MAQARIEQESGGSARPFPDADQPKEKAVNPSLNSALQESFSRVRDDIHRIQQVLNDQADKLAALDSKIEGFVNMYEFFEYMQHIDKQMEQFKETFLKQEAFEKHARDLREKVEHVDQMLKRDAKLRTEVDHLRSAPREKGEEQQGFTHVYQELNKLDADILTMKKVMNQQRKLEFDITTKFGGVGALATSIQSIEKNIKANAETIERLQEHIEKEQHAVQEDVSELRRSRPAKPK